MAENRAETAVATREVATGVWACIQTPGTWGFGNAGLVVGEGASLLIDTFNDLAHTRRLLEALSPTTTGQPLCALVNTSGESDHCWGNQLITGPEVRSYMTPEAWTELQESAPGGMQRLSAVLPILPKAMKRIARVMVGPFDFRGIVLSAPTHLVDAPTSVLVGGRSVSLLPATGARCASDLAVWVEDASVLFAGDLVVSGHAPAMSGSLDRWREALRQLAALHPEVVVPGHGPIGGPELIDQTLAFVEWLDAQVAACHAAGLSAAEGAQRIHEALGASPFAGLQDAERLVITVHHRWGDLEPDHELPEMPVLISQLGKLRAA